VAGAGPYLGPRPAPWRLVLAPGVSAAARAEVARLAGRSGGRVRLARIDGRLVLRVSETPAWLNDWARRHGVPLPDRHRTTSISRPEAVVIGHNTHRTIGQAQPATLSRPINDPPVFMRVQRALRTRPRRLDVPARLAVPRAPPCA